MNQSPASQPPPPPPGQPGYRQFGVVGPMGVGPGGSAGPDGPGDGTTYGPLQRRLLGLVGLLASLMIALIVFHALHTGSTGLNAVAEAAERTARMPGGKLAMEVTYTVEGLPGQTAPRSTVANGGGDYDAKSGRAKATLTVPVPGRGTVSIESVGNDRQVFLRSSAFSGELPTGKEWIGMEPFLGHDPQMALGSGGGGKSQLELLKAVGGGVEKLDQQTVRGHLTTRYKGSVELGKAADLFSEDGEAALAKEYGKFAELMPAPIPVEVWIDEKGLTRQVRMLEPLPTTPGGPTVSMDMRIQYYAFGARPKIDLPSKSAVLDITPLLRAELGMEDGSTVRPLTPPAGAKPLSSAAFRDQVRGICQAFVGKAGSFAKGHVGAIEAMKAIHSDGGSVAEKRHAIAAAGFVYEHLAGIERSATRRLARISPPVALAPDYRRLQLINAKQSEWLLAFARASQLGPSALVGLKARTAEVKTEEAESDRLEKRIGFPHCGTTTAPAAQTGTA